MNATKAGRLGLTCGTNPGGFARRWEAAAGEGGVRNGLPCRMPRDQRGRARAGSARRSKSEIFLGFWTALLTRRTDRDVFGTSFGLGFSGANSSGEIASCALAGAREKPAERETEKKRQRKR